LEPVFGYVESCCKKGYEKSPQFELFP